MEKKTHIVFQLSSLYKVGCWFVLLVVTIWLELFTSCSFSWHQTSSLAAIELANPGSPGKVAVKMERERKTNQQQNTITTWNNHCRTQASYPW